MNKIFLILIASIFTLNSVTINAQKKGVDQITAKVDGLGCPFCAYGLEKKMKEFKGIKKMKIDIETGILTFNFPSSEMLSIEKIEAQVNKAGYTPINIEIKRMDGTLETSKQDTKVADVGDLKTIKFFVAGNCGMCKSRIEKAAKEVAGVQEATWNQKTKLVTVKTFKEVLQNDIEKAIATAGHDTKNEKAKDDTYSELPVCCLYERIEY